MDLQAVNQLGPQDVQQGGEDSRGIPAVFRQEALPTGQVAVNPEAGVSHTAHRFPPAGQQQAQDVAAEEGEARSGKVRPKEQ